VNVSKQNKLKNLTREDGYLYTGDIVASGIRKEKLAEWMEQGLIVREARGIYSVVQSEADEFTMLQTRCKKGIYSFGTALYFHGLSDRFPNVISMTVPQNYNVYYLQKELHQVHFHRVKPEWWGLGITGMISPQGGTIKVYNKERCICDIIRFKDQSDPQIFIQACRTYFKSKNKDIITLMSYARAFRIEQKVENYLEVLV
jgi:predicted transcriptional regulator of viral defense system